MNSSRNGGNVSSQLNFFPNQQKAKPNQLNRLAAEHVDLDKCSRAPLILLHLPDRRTKTMQPKKERAVGIRRTDGGLTPMEWLIFLAPTINSQEAKT